MQQGTKLATILLVLAAPALGSALAAAPQGHEPGFATMDLKAHLAEIASPHLEGRDSPSKGLERAGDYIIARLEEVGIQGADENGGFRMPYTRTFQAPVPGGCHVEVNQGENLEALELGVDYVPLAGCEGKGSGRPVFLGFGITDSGERYDDLKGKRLSDTVAVIFEGEPRHKKLFEGPDEVTRNADLFTKIQGLEKAGASGVMIIRRAPPEEIDGRDGKPLAPTPLGFRYSWASWNQATTKPMSRNRSKIEIPVVEITVEVANRLFGEDFEAVGRKMDKSGKPKRYEAKKIQVDLATRLEEKSVPIDNVVGLLPGTDEGLKDEYLVLGAHYDHIGVDSWGRVGAGADDNGSGTVGLIELAEAMAAAPPRRSVIFAWFSSEEDGLLGSAAFCDDPPVAKEKLVAMLNMDMIGRGEESELVVLGTKENPDLDKLLPKAKKLESTKIKKVITGKANHLWQRSDHYSFHEAGIPSLFFFEAVSETDNADYHTFRDTVERLNLEKIARTTRFVFNTAWLVANADKRPSPPR